VAQLLTSMKAPMRAGKMEEPDTSVLHLLHRATQCMEDLFHVATSGLDITNRQFLLLEHIAKREGLSQTDLVKRTGIDRSTMADVVQRLVKKRYVERRRTENDARAYMIALTAEGRAAIDEAKSIADRVDKEFLSVLPTRRAEHLLTTLLSVVQALRPLIEAPTNSAGVSLGPIRPSPQTSESPSQGKTNVHDVRFSALPER